MMGMNPAGLEAVCAPKLQDYPVLRKNKAFLLMFSASTLSVLGNSFHSLALSLWVLQETGSATMMSIMTVTNLIICSLLGSITGTLADRMNRRTLILCAYLVQSSLVLCIAWTVAQPHAPFVLLVILTALATTAGQFQVPAFQASLLTVVGRAHIGQAAGWMTLSENISRTAGYALGGIFVAAFGGAWAISIDGFAFLLAFVLVLLAGPFNSFTERQGLRSSFRQDILSGFRYIWANPFARAVTLILPVLSLFFLSSLMLTQVMAVQVWQATPFQFGLMEACIPLGYMLGSGLILSAGSRIRRRGRIIAVSLVAIGPLYAMLSVTASMSLAIPLILLIGFTFSFSTLLINIIMRMEVPEDMQGRMFGVLGSIMSVAPPAGLAVFATSADHFGAERVMLGGAVMLLLFGTAAVLKFRMIRDYE